MTMLLTPSARVRRAVIPREDLGMAHHETARFFVVKYESVAETTAEVRLNDVHLCWLHNGNGGNSPEPQRLLWPERNVLEIRVIHRPAKKKRMGRVQLFGLPNLDAEHRPMYRFLDVRLTAETSRQGLALSFDVSPDALPPSTFCQVCDEDTALSSDDVDELCALMQRLCELYRGGDERAWDAMYAWNDEHHLACRLGEEPFSVESEYLVDPDYELAPTLRFDLVHGGRIVEVRGEAGFETRMALATPDGQGHAFSFARTPDGWKPIR